MRVYGNSNGKSDVWFLQGNFRKEARTNDLQMPEKVMMFMLQLFIIVCFGKAGTSKMEQHITAVWLLEPTNHGLQLGFNLSAQSSNYAEMTYCELTCFWLYSRMSAKVSP